VRVLTAEAIAELRAVSALIQCETEQLVALREATAASAASATP
jgi:hypothetical protein